MREVFLRQDWRQSWHCLALTIFYFFGLNNSVYGQVSVPNTFTPGATIKSADVNENFDTLEDEINALSRKTAGTTKNPVVIDVACNGTGTPLQDMLNSLNPVSSVYRIEVSGVCNELLVIEDFSRLTIRSKNPDNRASIRSISNTSGFFVRLEDFEILFDQLDNRSQNPSAIGNFSAGRLDVVDVNVRCVNSGACRNAAGTVRGEIRLYSVTKSGTWSSDGARVSADRQGSILVASSGPLQDQCYIGDEYSASRGGVIRYLPESEFLRNNCPIRKVENTGGLVVEN